MFWKLIIYDDDFLSSLSNPGEIADLSKWRLQYFIKNLVETNSPLSKWNHETCPTHQSFHLFGLNDDGLGNKKLEVTPHVHHITPKVEGGSNADSNLIVLCRDCHGKAHGVTYTNKQLKGFIKRRRKK